MSEDQQGSFGGENTTRALRSAISLATGRAKAAANALKLVRSALSEDSPIAAPIGEAISAIEDSIAILRSGHLGEKELEGLSKAALRAETALESMQFIAMLPGPLGKVGRLLVLLRSPLHSWARYISRDPKHPTVPSPLELAVKSEGSTTPL